MRFKLYIDCDNAAFEDDCSAEIARILKGIAGSLRESGCTAPHAVASWIGRGEIGKLYDVNGNTVGKVSVDEGRLS